MDCYEPMRFTKLVIDTINANIGFNIVNHVINIIPRLDSVPESTIYAKSIGINCVFNSSHRVRSNNSLIGEKKQNGNGDYCSL